MQLGISTYSFPWSVGIENFKPDHLLSAKDLLDYAALKNIRFVQFGDNYPLHLLPRKELMQLQLDAEKANIQIQPGTKRLTIDNVRQYLSIANTVKADFIRMVVDDNDYCPSVSNVVEMIKVLLPALEKANVRLALENHDRFSVRTLKMIVQNTSPQWVGICLDTANSIGAAEGLTEVVEHLAPYCINLHIKDFIIKRVEHKMGFCVSGCIAGSGMLNIPWLVTEISKYGRCTTATLEVWSDPEPTINATLIKEKKWVNASLDYLKTITL